VIITVFMSIEGLVHWGGGAVLSLGASEERVMSASMLKMSGSA